MASLIMAYIKLILWCTINTYQKNIFKAIPTINTLHTTSLWFLVSAHRQFFSFLFLGLWNDVQLQPNVLFFFFFFFHIGVWTFAWFVRPLLVTILYVWEIWSGSNNRVYMYPLAKTKQACHHTDFEADLWPETTDFLGT